MDDIKKKTLTFFDSDAPTHHQKSHIENPANQKRLLDVITKIKPHLKYPMLEVGCGSGDSGLLLNPNVAVDFSPVTVKIAKKLLGNRDIRLANAEDLPFKDNEFEGVVGIAVLQHCFNPEKAIDEAVRVSRDSVIFVTNNYPQYYKTTDPILVHRFSLEFLENIVKKYRQYKLEVFDRLSIIYINK